MSTQEETKKVMAYLIGYRLGSQMLPQMLPGLATGDLDNAMLAKGIEDAMSGAIDEDIANNEVEQHQHAFMSMLQERMNNASANNQKMGEEYLAANATKEGVTTTASGLQYEVLRASDEPCYDPAVHGDAPTAEVLYKGSLIDGTVFDESSSPVKFNITQVIPGFTEALKAMPIGSKWRVTIPAALAYGAQGPGSIGPNSTLIFEMELLALVK